MSLEDTAKEMAGELRGLTLMDIRPAGVGAWVLIFETELQEPAALTIRSSVQVAMTGNTLSWTPHLEWFTEGAVRKFEDANGRPLWPGAAVAGMVQGSPRMILDSPVNNSEWMPAIGADAKVLLYGDFSAYIIAQRAQITTVILRERFADTDQTGIILFERVGGALWNEDAFRVGTLS